MISVLGQRKFYDKKEASFRFSENLFNACHAAWHGAVFTQCCLLTKDKNPVWGTWVTQSVKRLILDSGSGHDLPVYEFELARGSVLAGWTLLGILSLPLSAPPQLCLFFSK